MDYNLALASFSVTEFRAFRKALAVLTRAGIDRDTAVKVLVEASRTNRENRERYRYAHKTSAA